MAKLIKLNPFIRGDTPLFVVPVRVGTVVPDISAYTAYLTFTTNADPTTNADAFLHVPMTTSASDTLGLGYEGYFYHQFTNTETENIDPDSEYYWDVQINKSPQDTNNFTIVRGTFTPDVDFSRGLS